MTSKREHVDGRREVEGSESINGDGRDEEQTSNRDTLEEGREGKAVVQDNLTRLNRSAGSGRLYNTF